jgi:outer membrane biosynthesis protein TonB
MKAARKIAVSGLLGVIAGCAHKAQITATPPPPAPYYTPTDVAKAVPMPLIPPPKPWDVKLAVPEVAELQPPKQHKTTHHKPKPAETADTQPAKDTTPPAAAPAERASAGEPPEMSPIGQLSSTEEHSGVPTHHQIQEDIKATVGGLNGIKRPLSADEQQTVEQIRTFLAKAQKALDQDDLDGANTLVKKAKVLLDELTKT